MSRTWFEVTVKAAQHLVHVLYVLSDLSLAFAKLRPGGVLVGDDWHWSWGEAAGAPSSSRARAPVGEAVLDFLALHGPRAALIGVCHGRYVLHKDGGGAPS